MEVGAGLSDFMRETGFGGCPLTIAAIVRVRGKVFSHFGIRILRVFEIDMGTVVGLIMGAGIATDDGVLSISGNGISELHIFDKTSKRL